MMASSTKLNTPLLPEALPSLDSPVTNPQNAGIGSNNPGVETNNSGISVSNTGISINNTGINFGQQIGQANYKYFTTISDKTSHKRFAESSFTKYKNLRFDGTCEWLLKEESYKEWAECIRCQQSTDGDGPLAPGVIKIIRISGKMGCGKSTLVARAIEHVQERETPGSGHRVLYFFASSLRDVDEARLKNLQPTFKNVLLTFWDQLHVDKDGGIGGAVTKNLSEKNLMAGIIGELKASKTKHISILIDAIDTLSWSDQESLNSTFLEECKKHEMQVCFLMSYTHDSKKGSSDNEIRITPKKNELDMEKFLRAKLSEKMLQQDETGEEEKDKDRKELAKEEKDEVEGIVKKIMDRAQEMFLWAAVMLDLVCRAHDKKEREQVLERLLLPISIQDDYEKLVEGWEGKTKTARGRLEEWQRKLALQTTGLLAHKQGLLSYDALTEALEEQLPEAAAQKREAEAQKRVVEDQKREAEARKRAAAVRKLEAEVRKLEAEVRKQEAEALEREAEMRKQVALKVVECCSPFIEYDGELRIFRFAHPSMHDFFVKRDASRTAFADQTLAYLCRPAFRRGPFSGAEWWDMGELRPFLDKHPFLGFAAANWVEAVRNSKAANGQNRKSTRNLLADLYGSDENLLLAFQVWRIAAQESVPARLRSAHVFSFFGLFDYLFSSSSRFATVPNAAVADEHGHNALHWALQADNQYTRLQTVRILMRADKTADMAAAQGSSHLTPLHLAARQGDLGVVRLLLSGDPSKRALNVCSGRYGTPLVVAASHGRVDVVEELIKAGADLDAKCDLGNVLHAAAAATPDEAAHACVDAILRNHLRPRRLDVGYYHQHGTPLHTAAYHGRESVVKLLLDAQFSASKRTWNHGSTITAAAAGCHRGVDHKPFIRIIEMLHDAGADAHAAGANGYFALHHAAQFNQPEIARVLHNCGADCHQKSTTGSPLQVAARFLHNYNADGHQKSSTAAPLQVAARFLHNCGTYFHSRSTTRTPLELAAHQGHMEVVRVLLQPRQKRQRAYKRERSENFKHHSKHQAEKARKRKEEKEKSTLRNENILRRFILAVWEPVWDSAVADNNMTRIYRLVDQYEQSCGRAIQEKTPWKVKALAALGTAVFSSVVGLMERTQEPQQKQQKLKHLRRKVLSSTATGALELYDLILFFFPFNVHNDRRTSTEFHPDTYKEILDRLTLAAVHMLSKAFEHENFDAVPPLAEAWIDALLAIKSVSLLEKLVEKRAQALKLILTDAITTPAEKRRDAGILAKVGIELLAVALNRRHDDDRLARSLAKLWATALHDAGGDAQDATRIEDIFHVCSAFLDMFQRACDDEESSPSRIDRVCLLARVGADIIVEAVRTDNEQLINIMRRMMDAGRETAATVGLKDEVEEVLMEKHDSLEKAGSTAPAKDGREKRDSLIAGQTTPVHIDKEMGGNIGGNHEGSNGKSNAREGSEHESSEANEGDAPKDEGSDRTDGKPKTDEEIESKRLRITLRILRGHE